MDAYRKGLNGPQAIWANRKYHGHQVLPDNIWKHWKLWGRLKYRIYHYSIQIMTSYILCLVSYTIYSLNEPGRHKLLFFSTTRKQIWPWECGCAPSGCA